MKRIVNAVVRIEYNDNTNSAIYDNELKETTAIGLTIRPNFCSVVNGISIDEVHIEPVDSNCLIDWEKVEHDPKHLLIKTAEV